MSKPIRSRPKVRDDLICRRVDEDFVVYDPVSDRTLLLNLSAAIVFELCDGSRTIDAIVTAAAQMYSTGEAGLLDDVRSTLADFSRQGVFTS